jgi:hypothetical protein
MVDCCVNPACGAEFKQLSGGDLYAIERRSADTEFFWLCSRCAAVFDVCLGAAGKVGLRRRGARGKARSPHPEGNLRLVTRGLRSLPPRDDTPASERPMIEGSGEWGCLAHIARF